MSETSNINWSLPTIGDPVERRNCIPVTSGVAICTDTKSTPFPVIRKFESGASRDLDDDKPDYEACLSPLVLEAFAEYMKSCTVMADGSRRPGDNWKKGIPLSAYMKSLMRHIVDMWKIHQGIEVHDRKTGQILSMKTVICAVLFNSMGYLHEWLKKENNGTI